MFEKICFYQNIIFESSKLLMLGVTVVDRRPEILIGDLVGTTTAPDLAAIPVMLLQVNIKVRAAARMRRRVTILCWHCFLFWFVSCSVAFEPF